MVAVSDIAIDQPSAGEGSATSFFTLASTNVAPELPTASTHECEETSEPADEQAGRSGSWRRFAELSIVENRVPMVITWYMYMCIYCLNCTHSHMISKGSSGKFVEVGYSGSHLIS